MIDTYVIPHWPFIFACLIFAMGGQVAKATVFTKANVLKYKQSGPALVGELIWWGRKTLPMLPVVLGFMLGSMPGMPVSSVMVDPTQAAVQLYYAGAGIVSTWAFAILKSVAKKKGIELDFPRESAVPPS